MITSLNLQCIKSWVDTGEMRLAPISGLFGTNSSGKTSILQMLLVLKQTVEATDRAQVLNLGDERSLVNVGSFRDLVHGHETPGSIGWTLTWSPTKPVELMDPERPHKTLFKPEQIVFYARVGDVGSRPTPRPILQWFGYSLLTRGATGLAPGFTMRRHDQSQDRYDLSSQAFEFKRFVGRPPRLPPPVKCYGFPDQVYSAYQNAGFLADLQLAFEELFARMYYLGPLREYPKRQYTWAGGQPSDMGQRGERVVEALLASRERGERISRGRGRSRRAVSLEEIVASWLQKLGLVHSFEVQPISTESSLYQVKVQKTSNAAQVLLTDVGFGVSQILPVLALCYYVPKGSTIILEQPEIHLHPGVQSGLADVLIDAVKTRGVQIILESHSEHLLRRLQRRIAEQKLSPDDAALYFCELQGGASKLTTLDVTTYGSIRNWPQGFFGDEMGDLVATTEAAMRRQIDETGT